MVPFLISLIALSILSASISWKLFKVGVKFILILIIVTLIISVFMV